MTSRRTKTDLEELDLDELIEYTRLKLLGRATQKLNEDLDKHLEEVSGLLDRAAQLHKELDSFEDGP